MMEAIAGGILIGISVSLMLYLNGRVTGISGILNAALKLKKNDTAWRFSFLSGLFLGGVILQLFIPEVFEQISNVSYFKIAIAGFLVGFGTVMGSGCTSGHGVCGISRLSIRSIIATLVFMSSGIFTVWVMQGFQK